MFFNNGVGACVFKVTKSKNTRLTTKRGTRVATKRGTKRVGLNNNANTQNLLKRLQRLFPNDFTSV